MLDRESRHAGHLPVDLAPSREARIGELRIPEVDTLAVDRALDVIKKGSVSGARTVEDRDSGTCGTPPGTAQSR